MMKADFQRSVERGFTLVETLITLSLIGVLMALAVPGIQDIVLKRRLEGAVNAYLSQLQWARTEAVVRNQPMYLGFGRTDTSTCYVFYTGERGKCACSQASDLCESSSQSKLSMVLPRENGIEASLTSNIVAVTIDPLRGTITPTFTAVFNARNGTSLVASTSVMGRTKACSQQGNQLAFPSCN